ncbi:MAG: CHAP domain-containing protein [Acutalibacteraceae bacterium]
MQKSARKITAIFLSVLLIAAVLMSTVASASALTYSGSSSYKSGKYYTALTKVQLTGNQRTDIVNVAKSQIGYQESNSASQLSGTVPGNGNKTEYGRWYGLQSLWCAMFVSWSANVAGVSTSVVPKHCATTNGLSWFQSRGQAYSRADVAAGKYTPQPGDIIYFKSARNSNPTNHVGIVTSYSNNTVYTVEGNTSSATVSTDGGAVAAKKYAITNTYIVYICKPNYPAAPNSGDNSSSGSTTNSKYFPACSSSQTTLLSALSSIGVDNSFAYRKVIAQANGIANYTGTAAQNTQLFNLLKQGKLINPSAPEETPTEAPTPAPTDPPTEAPTPAPTDPPTEAPTPAPTDPPTEAPTPAPTDPPTEAPTPAPTDPPTEAPTSAPTEAPTPAPSKYYPACSSSQTTLLSALSSIGVDNSFAYRKVIAQANGITNYTGTAAQNTQLFNLLKQGKLINPAASAETPTEAPTEAPTPAPTDPPTEAPTEAPTPAPTEAPTEAPTTAPSKYYPACSSSQTTLLSALSSIGVDNSLAYRKVIAQANGITNYTGTAAQNTQLFNLLKQGKLINPAASSGSSTPTTPTTPTTKYFKACSSSQTTLLSALKSIGVDNSLTYRKKIAKANGITNYTGTAAQNTKLLNLLKKGKLIKP